MFVNFTLWSINYQEHCKIGATMQMSDFKAKMHKIRFPLGLCPRPRWSLGELTALPQTS